MSGPTLYDTASPLVWSTMGDNSILLLTILLTSAFLLRSCVAAADASRYPGGAHRTYRRTGRGGGETVGLRSRRPPIAGVSAGVLRALPTRASPPVKPSLCPTRSPSHRSGYRLMLGSMRILFERDRWEAWACATFVCEATRTSGGCRRLGSDSSAPAVPACLLGREYCIH